MNLRAQNIAKLPQNTFDVLVVGAGINGAVAAAALAGKGAKVALVDKRDFAGFTSQHSSNLAWGGIKYMENWEFSLVRDLCKSRNHLIENFPASVQEIRFFTTVRKGFRWHPLMLWAGCWLYWLIGNGFTRPPQYKTRGQIQREEPMIDTSNVSGGFEYSDAYLHDNDARFVYNFVRTAIDHGCVAANYVSAQDAERKDGLWRVQAQDLESGDQFEIRAKVMVNAGGAFVDEFNNSLEQQTSHHHLFSKGIHLLVNRITPNRRVMAFFADDGRLFFAIPMGNRTCIGTTDTRVDDPVTEVTPEDRAFVLDNINRCLKLDKPLSEDDIIAERCGVRPLAIEKSGENASDFLQLSRKHHVDVDRDKAHLSIFGGKLTDCVNVGEEVGELVKEFGITLPKDGEKWYGEPSAEVHQDYLRRAAEIDLDQYTAPGAAEKLTPRLWRRYGAEALKLVEQIREDPTQGNLLIEGTEYIRCEIQQAAKREMIVKLEDFLRRRSKIALVVRREEIKNAPGLKEACRILFGDQAEERFAEYFAEQPDVGVIEPTTTPDEAFSEALNW